LTASSSGAAQLNIGLIGAGLIARDQHFPAWRKIPFTRVLAVADSSADALVHFGEEQVPLRFTDYRELLAEPRIDVVDICAPSGLHAEVTIAALRAGKHVLVEKPMATNRADAEAMLRTARECNRKLMVAQHLRFGPSMLQLRKYLERHPLGDVYYARGQWLRRRRLPARPGFTRHSLSGGGAIYDLGIHMFDLTWWTMGCPRPVTVTGGMYDHLSRRDDLGSEWGQWDHTQVEVDDFAAGLVRFENGALLSLEVSWLGFMKEPEFWRMQLFGQQRGLAWPDLVVTGETDRIPWDVQLSEPDGEKAHHETIRRFAEAVLNDQPVPVPPEQSATAIAVLEGLAISHRQGREQPIAPIQTG
jgi:predicted dehydrogenase